MTRTGPEQHRSYAEEWCHSLSTVSLRCSPGVNLPSEAARPGATREVMSHWSWLVKHRPLEFLWGTGTETFSSSTAMWLSIKVISAEMSNYLEFLWTLSVPFLIFPFHFHSGPPTPPTVCSLRILLCDFCDALRHAAKFLKEFHLSEPVLHVEDPPPPQERETHTVNSNRKHLPLLESTWGIVWTISETYHFPLKPAMTWSQTAPHQNEVLRAELRTVASPRGKRLLVKCS